MAQVRLTTKGILLVSVFMVLFAFGLGFGIWKVTGLPNLSPTDSSAAGCKGTSQAKCASTCSPPKGNDNTSYKCTWKNGECKDSNQKCSGGDGDGFFCQGKTKPDNDGDKDSCMPGTPNVCQQNNNGNNTGFDCNCVDISSTTNGCAGVWRCTTRDLNKCKPDPDEGQGPIKNGCWQDVIMCNGVPKSDGSGGYVTCSPSTFDPKKNGGCTCEKLPSTVGEGGYTACGCKISGNCLESRTATTFVKYTCEGTTLAEEDVVKGCQKNPQTTPGITKMCGSIGSGKCGWVQIDTTSGCFASWYYPCSTTPPGDTNKCDGGGLIGSASETGDVGDAGVFRGYANDVDGIGTVTILRNNSVVGTATTVDACSLTGDTRAVELCTQYGSGKVVVWTYNYVVQEGTAVYKAVWKDTKGLGGSSCETSKTVSGTTVVEQDDWDVSKNAGFVCINRDTESAQVRIDYTISVTNNASSSRNITRIVDTLDSDINPAWIQVSTINPGATVDGRVITWNLTGDLAVFAAGQTKLFRYSVLLPIGVGGTYDNTAVITPETGDDITVETTIFASCDIPDTAIFDSTISRVILGAILLLLGIAYLYYEPFTRYANLGLSYVFPTYMDKIERNRDKFERKVVKK